MRWCVFGIYPRASCFRCGSVFDFSISQLTGWQFKTTEWNIPVPSSKLQWNTHEVMVILWKDSRSVIFMRESIRSGRDYAHWNTLYWMGVERSRWSHICPVEDFWPLAVALCSFTAAFFAPLSLPYTSYLGLRVQLPMNLMERCFRGKKSRLPLNVTQSFATWCGSFVLPHDPLAQQQRQEKVPPMPRGI